MSDLLGIPVIDRLLARAKPSRNSFGNEVRETFLVEGDRYIFDFNLGAGWKEIDTESDAWYFGVWANRTELRILQYVEGELYFTICKDAASYNAELSRLCSANKAAPAFIVVDDDRSVTAHYQDRSEFFAPDPEGR